MNKAQYHNTEITGLLVFIRKAFVEMSCHGSVIISSNTLIVTLETLYNSVSSLSNILNTACCAPD